MQQKRNLLRLRDVVMLVFKMKRLFLVAAIAVLLFPVSAGAQTTQTIRGQVCDVASGEPINGVTILVENGITMGTVSDVYGNFVIENVPVGRHSIRATYVGYDLHQLRPKLRSHIRRVDRRRELIDINIGLHPLKLRQL